MDKKKKGGRNLGIDRELLKEVKNGDTHGFELIVETMQQPIFVYCYRMLGNIYEAEDAVQEVFLKVFDKINNFKENISFSAWVYKIAHNHCINQIRRRKLLNFVPIHSFIEQIEDESSSEGILDSQLSVELNRALSILSIEDRSILIFRVIEGKSYGEIGSIINKNEALIRKRYERARKRLEEYFKEKGGRGENERIVVV